ncbi:COPI associated protein, putative [Angomonas deanei]|uniref:COPI associated protein, putative n=1 Tax=Angomonas deanei TaxID=59799 RepID=A0A7G2C6B4_9TRYP|nr:COPI associated protein, putative [Angomonas deanei]
MTEREVSKVPHSKWVRALIWFNSASLIVCGVASFILQFFREKSKWAPTQFFIAIYWVFFGIISITVELELTIAKRFFGFAYTKFGQGLFFIFAGTLGMSFGVATSPAVLIPFIAGIVSILIGVACITDVALKKGGSRATVDGVV